MIEVKRTRIVEKGTISDLLLLTKMAGRCFLPVYVDDSIRREVRDIHRHLWKFVNSLNKENWDKKEFIEIKKRMCALEKDIQKSDLEDCSLVEKIFKSIIIIFKDMENPKK